MKKIIVILSVFLMYSYLCAQPSAFSWTSRHSNHYNYVSSAKDQEEQSPCSIFASVAAVEAMAQIYFNKDGATLNLSESNLYSGSEQCPERGCSGGALSVIGSLNFIKSSGIVNESCFPYPTRVPYCRLDCQNICGSPANFVTIPGYSLITPYDNTEVKRAIMDYGPIIVQLKRVGNVLHPGGGCPDCNHTVLILGWKSSPSLAWLIKDSWPNDAKIFYSGLDIFSYEPIFHYGAARL